MPKFALYLKAELDGVTSLRPSDDDGDYYYSFRVVCNSCHEPNDSFIGINRNDQVPLSKSRGEAGFVWSCKNCKRESSASIVEGPGEYNIDDSPQDKKLLTFECRGCEFTEYRADGAYDCKGAAKGTSFADIDLGEGEWYDYDEKAAVEVSITGVSFRIDRDK